MKTDLSIVSCIVAKSFKKITCFFKVIVYSSVVPSFHFIRVIHREAVKNCKGEKGDRGNFKLSVQMFLLFSFKMTC